MHLCALFYMNQTIHLSAGKRSPVRKRVQSKLYYTLTKYKTDDLYCTAVKSGYFTKRLMSKEAMLFLLETLPTNLKNFNVPIYTW